MLWVDACGAGVLLKNIENSEPRMWTHPYAIVVNDDEGSIIVSNSAPPEDPEYVPLIGDVPPVMLSLFIYINGSIHSSIAEIVSRYCCEHALHQQCIEWRLGFAFMRRESD